MNQVDSVTLLSKTQSAKTLGRDVRPIGPAAEGRVKPLDVYRAIVTGEPYPIRALVGFGSNICSRKETPTRSAED